LLESSTFEQTGLTAEQAGTSALRNEGFVQQRFSLDIDFNFIRNKISLKAYHDQREFQLALDKEKSFGGSVTWDWNISRRNQISLNTRWEKREFSTTTNENELMYGGISLHSQLGRKLSSTLSYHYTERDAQVFVDTHSENSARAKLTWFF